MSKSTDRLCAALTERMVRSARENQNLYLEMGTINRRRELIPDSLRKPIPYGQYMFNQQASFGEDPSEPEERILVAWVGVEPIALCPIHVKEGKGAISKQQIDYIMEGW